MKLVIIIVSVLGLVFIQAFIINQCFLTLFNNNRRTFKLIAFLIPLAVFYFSTFLPEYYTFKLPLWSVGLGFLSLNSYRKARWMIDETNNQKILELSGRDHNFHAKVTLFYYLLGGTAGWFAFYFLG